MITSLVCTAHSVPWKAKRHRLTKAAFQDSNTERKGKSEGDVSWIKEDEASDNGPGKSREKIIFY